MAALDLDQAELGLNPSRTRVWAPIGVPWELETPGDNRKQVMFGAVNSLTGQTDFALTARERSADFQQYVDREIIPAYAEADLILLIVDGSSIYKPKITRAWLAERPPDCARATPQLCTEAEPAGTHLALAAPRRDAQSLLRHPGRGGGCWHKSFFARLAQQPELVLQRIGMLVGPLERTLASIT